MPIPNHCIECDKVAVVTNNGVPYCVNCYKKETRYASKRSSNKSTRTMRNNR